jgi:formate hydrogenlyase transcriptional activator
MPTIDELLSGAPTFFLNVLESLSEGLVVTDGESRILYVNDRACSLAGRRRHELLGRTSYEMLAPPEQWPRMRERLQERQRGQVEEYEIELPRKDGSGIWVAVRAVPLVDEAGDIQGTIGAIRDISLRRQLEGENAYLQREVTDAAGSCDIIGASHGLRKVLEQVGTVGPTDAAVLVTGESGTGKELVARAVHRASGRHEKPLIRVNCAAVPTELFESEFFGHVRGAFTGAVRDRMGRFELADGGTLFLDEVGEIPLELQSKLLRVLQEGQFERVGDDRTRTVDVRIVAATNRQLAGEVEQGRFREDLYYRLSVFPIDVPPLRLRRDDIEPLARHFLREAAHRLGRPEPALRAYQVDVLRAYDWPGNVRELQHAVERAVIVAVDGELLFELPGRSEASDIAAPTPAAPTAGRGSAELSLDELPGLEKQILARHLTQKNWKIYGPGGAAESLGIRPTTLVSKMKKHGLQKPW